MKKILIALAIILVVMLGAGYLAFNALQNKNKSPNLALGDNIIEDECTDEYAALANNTVTANNAEEKVSPGAVLIMQKHYIKCNQTIETQASVPDDVVNMTKEEVEKAYPDWTVRKFSKSEITLYKDYNEICDEHYLITDKDGYIAVYTVDEVDNKMLKVVTETSLDYLSDYDAGQIKEGIRAHGNDELSSILEDFE